MARNDTPQGMHPEDIKAKVRKTGLSLGALALTYGLPEWTCRNALREPHLAAEQVILRHLGLAGHEVWPDRYLPDGASRITRRTKHPNLRRQTKHCLSGAAA